MGGTVVYQQPSTQKRRRLPLFVAALAGLVLILVVRAVVGGGEDKSDGGSSQADVHREGCTVLNVAASSEKAALLSHIADDYNVANHSVGGQCVDVKVASKASGDAASALARGWDERVDGTRPDVWTPASSSWPVIVRQHTTAQDRGNIIPEQMPSIAQTPLVVAMPKPMAEALGWPDKQLGWSDILSLAKDPNGWGSKGHAEWGAFKLGKTNPNFSTSGLNATIATYFAATGRSSDLSVGDVADPRVTAFVRGVEQSVVHYGDTTLTFLENLYRAGEQGHGLNYISAVTVEEKSVWDYNRGNPSGDPATLGKQGPPRVPLVAIYPKEGTLVSDNPYIVLNAEWVNDAKRAAAADFLKFVLDAKEQKRFTDAAFRTHDGKPGAQISTKNGLLPDAKFTVIDPPGPTVLAKVASSWDSLRKRARVLVVIDVSGSMTTAVEGTGKNRLDLAKQAAIGAVDQLAPDDQLGLWTFSTPTTGPDPWRKLIEPTDVKQALGGFKAKVNGLVPEGGTALYATTRAAVESMRSSFDPDKINAVVLLTDGKNEYPQDNNLDSLLSDLSQEDTEHSVRVFPIAYGGQASFSQLEQIGQASRATAYDASDPASIGKVLAAVLSNF